jgi:cytochrome c-type biogenesis protein CcmF
MEVTRNAQPYTVLYPENRVYPVENRPTTEAAIETTLAADLYVALGNEDAATGGFVVRIYHKPLVVWMWIGAMMLVLGSIVSLTDRRHRIGAPTKSPGKSKAHGGAVQAAPAE